MEYSQTNFKKMGYYNGYGRFGKAKSFQTHTEHPNNVLSLDKELLKQLLTVQAPSEYEKDMQEFVYDWIGENVPNAVVKVDHYGNIMVTKGKSKTFPCVVAHMDEVNDFQTNRVIVEIGNLFVGLNGYTGEFAGCPGDDRVGCYTALEMLRVIPNIKVAFFVEEEIGGIGSNACDIAFFNDCSFILQADRNNNFEIITETNGSIVASEAFKKAILPYMKEYDYRFGTGTFTDVGVLANRGAGVSCINMGCGYYDAHSEEEKVCLPDVENVLNLMYYFCTYLPTKKWKHRAIHKVYKQAMRSNMGGKNSQYEYNGRTKHEEVTTIKYRPNEDFDDYDDAPIDYAVSKLNPHVDDEDEVPCMNCQFNYNCMSCEYAKVF